MRFKDYVGYFVSTIIFCVLLAVVLDVFYLIVAAVLTGIFTMLANGFNPLDKSLLVSFTFAGVLFGLVVGIGTIYDEAKKARQ